MEIMGNNLYLSEKNFRIKIYIIIISFFSFFFGATALQWARTSSGF
jgi:diacylglycerol kinase